MQVRKSYFLFILIAFLIIKKIICIATHERYHVLEYFCPQGDNPS